MDPHLNCFCCPLLHLVNYSFIFTNNPMHQLYTTPSMVIKAYCIWPLVAKCGAVIPARRVTLYKMVRKGRLTTWLMGSFPLTFWVPRWQYSFTYVSIDSPPPPLLVNIAVAPLGDNPMMKYISSTSRVNSWSPTINSWESMSHIATSLCSSSGCTRIPGNIKILKTHNCATHLWSPGHPELLDHSLHVHAPSTPTFFRPGTRSRNLLVLQSTHHFSKNWHKQCLFPSSRLLRFG